MMEKRNKNIEKKRKICVENLRGKQKYHNQN